MRGVCPVCSPVSFPVVEFQEFEITSLVFRWKEDDTTLVLTFCRIDCLRTVKCEHYRNRTGHDNALHEIVVGPNFPSHTVENVKLKIKTIPTGYAAEPAKVMKSEKSVSSLDDVHGKERERQLITVCVCCGSATSRQLLTMALKGGGVGEVRQNCKFGTYPRNYPTTRDSPV
jgi:hypothetical protein